MTATFDFFTVAGLDGESMNATEPVFVSCDRCGDGEWFLYRDDGGADQTAPLGQLVTWASEHRCDPGGEPA